MTEITCTCCLTGEEEEEMKHLFTAYDVDENGMLELDELQKMFANFNVIALKEDIKAFFERVCEFYIWYNTTVPVKLGHTYTVYDY